MPKGMSRTRGVKKKVNPLVEHIADFSDIEYDSDDSLEIIDAHATQKRDDECEDETDRTWMYKDPGDEEIVDEDEVTDEDLPPSRKMTRLQNSRHESVMSLN